MDSRKQEDVYYAKIPVLIKNDVPEFNSLFDGFDEIYMILGEFGGFIIRHIEDKILVERCISFINKSLNTGGVDTENAIVMQVFMPIYHKNKIVQIYQELLTGKALCIFNEFYEKRHSL